MSSLTVYAPQITILDHVVNTIEGLYSLKDLHKASGGDNKHAPFRFMRNAETKELIEEIERSPDMVNGSNAKAYKVVQGGTASKQGTYACKELVYRYAMWISPKFALIVIRTFDKVITGEVKVSPSQISTTTDRRPLVEAVNIYCAKTGVIFSDIWKMIHQRFNVDDVSQLTVEQVPQAIEYVHGFTINCHTKETPLSDFTHNQYIMNVKKEIMEYVHLLRKMIVAGGYTLPKYPEFDKEEICQAFLVSMIRHNRMMLSFDYRSKPTISFIPEEHAVVSSESISSVVQFADKKQLPSIINEAVKRLGE